MYARRRGGYQTHPGSDAEVTRLSTVSTWSESDADYDVRQLRLMLRALGEYLDSGRRVADLGRLVASLDALGSALESPDRQWLTKFEDKLLTLESVYAVASIAARRCWEMRTHGWSTRRLIGF
jgi:hypothetical protein